MSIYEQTPVLVAKTKTGDTKYWQAFADETDGLVTTYSSYYQIKQNGTHTKTIVSESKVISSKNVGRTNELTPHDQAISEINSEMALKMKPGKGYEIEGQEAPESTGLSRIRPMLAEDMATLNPKKKASVTYKGYTQPKLDGCRALFNKKLGFWSRGGNTFLPEVTQNFVVDTGEVILDGEMMLPDGALFEDSITVIKKYRSKEVNDKLEYHVFDCYDPNQPDLPFPKRIELLKAFHLEKNKWIHLVPTYVINSKEDLEEMYLQFLEEGHEGAMIREGTGPYVQGHRTMDLIKYKPFIDGEFKILDVIEGEGKEAGCARFECQAWDPDTNAFRKFKVRPRGSAETRKEIFQNPVKWIGKEVTVRYQNLSKYNVPRFGRALLTNRKEVE